MPMRIDNGCTRLNIEGQDQTCCTAGRRRWCFETTTSEMEGGPLKRARYITAENDVSSVDAVHKVRVGDCQLYRQHGQVLTRARHCRHLPSNRQVGEAETERDETPPVRVVPRLTNFIPNASNRRLQD